MDLLSVRDHINSIPRIESHYLRAQTTRDDFSSFMIEKQYPQMANSVPKIVCSTKSGLHIFLII
ncbi:Uncharacterized protein FWK35_00007735 [Aphis craccivora]|uniref:Uncharacterized protein n=1 Tax=Aphis craccivora TaxID=307492 RepID=A0A6G0YU57_APHCR|nr:Uncharacterized protein FWK35_00007735 [Aphis craccivora]